MSRLSVGDEGAEVQQCGACHGVWFDWWAGESSALANYIAVARGGVSPPRRQGACPRDGAPLEERPYLDSGPVVERCGQCLGLFARRTQLGQLAAFYHRMPNTRPEPITRSSLFERWWYAFAG
jgi:hypothetical protein